MGNITLPAAALMYALATDDILKLIGVLLFETETVTDAARMQALEGCLGDSNNDH